jgi:hypothetical protein
MKIIQSSKLFKLNNCLQNCSNEKKIQIKNLQILKISHIFKRLRIFNKKNRKNEKNIENKKP